MGRLIGLYITIRYDRHASVIYISDISYLFKIEFSQDTSNFKLIKIFYMDLVMQTCREIKTTGLVRMFNTDLMSINYGL